MKAKAISDVDLIALADEVARRLAALGIGGEAPDGRVNLRPDPRTVRYYQGLGLVDRPKIRARRARYGERHLVQLVAIKALQARGLPLRTIQERLLGRTDQELRALSRAAAPAPNDVGGVLTTTRRREAELEPGLRLVVDEAWAPGLDRAELRRRWEAALDALGVPAGLAEPRALPPRSTPPRFAGRIPSEVES